MARGTYAKITGLARTQRALARVYTVCYADLEDVLPKVGKLVAEDAASHVNKDTHKLEGSIGVGSIEHDRGVTFLKVGPTKEGWYGRFLEFGTRLLTAVPFLRPARDRHTAIYKTKLRASQAQAIKRV